MIVGDMERKHNINLFLLSVLLLMTAACSTTRNLPEDETLYVGVKNMEILNEDKTPAGVQTLEEVEAALSYPPNNAILGSNSLRFPIPFGLWIYNDFVKYQDKKGVGHWIFNKLGSTPVYLSTVNPETRVKVATNLLHDYGFFNGAVTYSVDSLKNPRKAKLSYKIDMANPYYLDSVMYLKYPPRADSLIRAAYDQRVLHKGDNFSVLKLEEERQRLSTLFRNNGYYYFRPEFITFRADTLRKPGMVSLQVVPKAGVPADAKRPYYIGNTSVYLTGYKGEEPTDSIVFPGMTLHYSGKKPGIRPGVLAKRFFYQKGQLYSQTRQNFTQEALARLGIFKFAEFRYAPQDTLPGCDTLNVRMNATFDLPYDGELEFNVTTKSTDQTGPGATVFVYDHEKFTPADMLQMIQDYRITSLCAPPTIFRFLIREDMTKYDLSSLQYCTIAGEALNPAVFDTFYKLTGIKLMEGFGQTETTLTVATFPWMEPKPGSMGVPNPQYDVDLLRPDGSRAEDGEQGQIVIHTTNGKPIGLFKEYYRDAERTREAWHDGLYYTGDVAWRDEDGYLWFVGRADDVIKSSGYRIGPFEVESALMTHPAVVECAITGVPDEIRGQVVKATIVLAKDYKDKAGDALVKELQNHVKRVTAPYKYPRVVEFVDELPKTISGKIRRVEIRDKDNK